MSWLAPCPSPRDAFEIGEPSPSPRTYAQLN